MTGAWMEMSLGRIALAGLGVWAVLALGTVLGHQLLTWSTWILVLLAITSIITQEMFLLVAPSLGRLALPATSLTLLLMGKVA